MTTSITRPAPTGRLRLQDTTEARAAGTEDARQLLEDLNELTTDPDGVCSSGLLIQAMTETIALATEHHAEESNARLEGFAEVVGPLHYRAAALDAKCTLLSAALNQADRVSQTFTESEGGEL